MTWIKHHHTVAYGGLEAPRRRAWNPVLLGFALPYATVLIWIMNTGAAHCENGAAMKPVRPRRMFRYWTSHLALLAMLALAAMPTAGRLYAGATPALATAAIDSAAHAGHAASTPEQPTPAPDGRDHRGHADCPYCPLLGELPDAPRHAVALTPGPPGPAPALNAAAGHAGLRPHGLHARGPPRAA